MMSSLPGISNKNPFPVRWFQSVGTYQNGFSKRNTMKHGDQGELIHNIPIIQCKPANTHSVLTSLPFSESP